MILNKAIIANPMNWFTVTLMLIILGIAGHLVLGYFGYSPSTPPEQATGDTPATTAVALNPRDGTFNAISVGK